MAADGKVTAIIFRAVGLFLIFNGLTAEYLVDAGEGTVTEDMKQKSKATPLTRTVVVSVGIASAGWAVYHLLH